MASLLRLWLVALGGRFFLGDEGRYERGVQLYQAIAHGEWNGVSEALSRPEHVGFTVLGAAITGLQHLTAQVTSWRDWGRPENVIFSLVLGAGWLAQLSVLNIWLAARLAAASGAGPAETAWVALLMATSTSGFYYARHFVPYDAAITFALGALWAAAAGRAVLCGMLAAATYHCYNGYWYLVPLILGFQLSYVGDPRIKISQMIKATAAAGAGLLLPVGLGVALAGGRYWETLVAFSGTVNQGAYREGWSLPWSYFAATEGGLGLALAAAVGAAVVLARTGGQKIEPRFGRLLALLGAGYVLLVLLSVGLEKFVVYARSAKPLWVFACLAGGWAAQRLCGSAPFRSALAAAGCIAMAAINFSPHFAMVFPSDIEQKVLRELGNPKHTLSVSGSLYQVLALPVTRPELVLVNAQLLYPVRGPLPLPAGRKIFQVPHPLSYPPYQYEGHSPRERAILESNPIDIYLIRLDNPTGLPDDLPVPLRFGPADRPTGRETQH